MSAYGVDWGLTGNADRGNRTRRPGRCVPGAPVWLRCGSSFGTPPSDQLRVTRQLPGAEGSRRIAPSESAPQGNPAILPGSIGVALRTLVGGSAAASLGALEVCDERLTGGRRPPGQRPPATGHRPPATGHRPPATGFLSVMHGRAGSHPATGRTRFSAPPPAQPEAWISAPGWLIPRAVLTTSSSALA